VTIFVILWNLHYSLDKETTFEIYLIHLKVDQAVTFKGGTLELTMYI